MTPAAVIAEARRWIGTPYHHRASVFGAGVDCARMPIAVYSAVGIFPWYDPGEYTPDWFLHQREERYLEQVRRWGDEANLLRPGYFCVWQFGYCYAHGGIVTEWPWVVHAYAPNEAVEEGNASLESDWTTLRSGRPRPMLVFRPRGLQE